MLRHKQIILVAMWILATGFGLHMLLSYKGMAGAPGQPPLTWPRNELVSLSSQKPLLVMFAHPRCPCTKASLAELEQLVALANNQFEAAVLFYEPKGGSKTWSSNSLIDEARLIPGARVIFDLDGNLARRFGVETSGHALVYSADGNLLFTGGITGSRGHLGDNGGLATVSKIITKNSIQLARTTTTPVFGCELFNQCTRNQTAAHN